MANENFYIQVICKGCNRFTIATYREIPFDKVLTKIKLIEQGLAISNNYCSVCQARKTGTSIVVKDSGNKVIPIENFSKPWCQGFIDTIKT